MAYDPVKAHEYYVKYRKKGLKKGREKGEGDSKSSKSKKTSLVGLSNSGLNDAGKMQYALVKDRLTSEMNEELDGVTDKDEIQRIREKYQQKALNEVTKLKNDSKYKQESKTSAKSTAKTVTKSTGTATKSASTKASSKASRKSASKKKKSSKTSSATNSAIASERAAAERKLATINRLKTEVQTLQQRVRDIISSGQISPENKGKAQTAINEVLSKLRELSAAAR